MSASPSRVTEAREISGLHENYFSALEQYLAHGDESALGRGYEIGRQAMAAGKSLIELASVHHAALEKILGSQREEGSGERVLHASARFFSEALSPYEMAHRGFQEAVSALRQMNDRLEAQIKRIAYAVHDEAGQLLAAVHLGLASLAVDLPDNRKAQVIQIEELLNDVESQLRQYSHELRPTLLDDLGWIPAIRFLADGVAKRANVAIHVLAEFADRLPGPAETAIYRVIQEALNNVVRHSGAKDVWIIAQKKHGVLCCSIRDNGGGFRTEALSAEGRPRGLGISSMSERLNAVGGSLQIKSIPGKGTELMIQLPMENSDADPSHSRG